MLTFLLRCRRLIAKSASNMVPHGDIQSTFSALRTTSESLFNSFARRCIKVRDQLSFTSRGNIISGFLFILKRFLKIIEMNFPYFHKFMCSLQRRWLKRNAAYGCFTMPSEVVELCSGYHRKLIFCQNINSFFRRVEAEDDDSIFAAFLHEGVKIFHVDSFFGNSFHDAV